MRDDPNRDVRKAVARAVREHDPAYESAAVIQAGRALARAA